MNFRIEKAYTLSKHILLTNFSSSLSFVIFNSLTYFFDRNYTIAQHNLPTTIIFILFRENKDFSMIITVPTGYNSFQNIQVHSQNGFAMFCNIVLYKVLDFP